MRMFYTILELDRHLNSNLIRSKVTSIEEIKSRVCDGRIEYPKCVNDVPDYSHLFRELTNVGFIGLWISTLNVFNMLINSDYDSVLVFEDDAVLVDGFDEKLNECLTELPNDFGLFSIGYREIYLNSYSSSHNINKINICKLFQTGDSWAIIYNKPFVIDLMGVLSNNKKLSGISDTLIMSYALGNICPIPNYESYSISPTLGSLVLNNSYENSTIQNSPSILYY